MKIGSHDRGRTADTCVAMNVHGMSLAHQARQRSHTFGKTQLQVVIVEILDGNVLERETGSNRFRTLLFDPTMTSFFFLLQAENCSDLERQKVLEIPILEESRADPQVGLDA
jgi:hypothetical protein